MDLFLILVLGYTASSTTLVLLKRAFNSESMKDAIISEDPRRAVDSASLRRIVRKNSIVSIVFMTVCSIAFYDFLIYGGEVSLWRIPLEIVLVTLIYDFLYYAVHRFPFHDWKLLRRVHSIHHKTQHPRGIDSLLLHPAETCIGLGAFLASVMLVGGVHVYSFAVLFVGYTTINVINHAGINFPHFPFRTLGLLAVKHDKHHHSMRSGNYAFLTSIPDTLFGTAE